MTASLLVLVIGLVSSLVVVLGERCGLFQYKVRNTSGQINCVKCPLCPRGHEPALKCFGKLVYQGPIVSTCRRCRPGTYQSLPSYGPCKPCIGCPMHRIVLRNCTHLESGKCGKCCDPGYYFDNVKFHCIQCCKCSNSSKDMVEPQCADVREVRIKYF